MQVSGRNADVGMSRRVSDFGQCPTTSQGMANEGVAAMVNGERGDSVCSQHLAGGTEAPA